MTHITKKVNTWEERLRETKNNVLGLATKDGGRQWRTKDVSSGQINIESAKMKTCHIGGILSIEIGQGCGSAVNIRDCKHIRIRLSPGGLFCRQGV